MNKRLLSLIIFVLIGFITKAQPGKEAWHWWFGGHAKLDFSSGSPVATNGGLYTFEACASISDANTGQLLFQANPNIAINKNDATMINGSGLFGSNAADQGTLIVPKPGSSTIFYLFTGDNTYAGNLGIHYHIIDMSLQNGLGKLTLKNQVLTPATTAQKLVGVRHCNGTDYWVITHPFYSNTFNAYLVDSAGLHLSPVVSNAGTIENCLSGISGGGHFYCNEGEGYLKASPNGKKLAMGINSDSLPLLEIFDFNNNTGIVSNAMTINYPGAAGPYGLSFSPDNTKLYACPFLADTMSTIYQYDVSSNVLATIIASQTMIAQKKIGNNSSGFVGAMQMAPDGKIYIARYSIDTLAVINNPNNAGTTCNFQWGGLHLTGGSFSYGGLPNFIDANYAGIQINLPDIQQCNTFTTTTLDAGSGFTNYFWSTGANTQTISVSSPGKYWVTVTNAQGCTKTDTINAYLLKPLKSDTLVCDTFHANVTQSGVLGYTWFDANHNPKRNFTQSGNYYVDIAYVSGCAIRDSINLIIAPSPKINLGRDTAFCLGDLKLNAGYPKSIYNWSTGETTQSITVTKAGVYFVNLIDSNGCKGTDTMVVHPQLGAFDFKMPNIVTPNDDNINDVIDFGTLQFSELQLEIFNRWGTKIFESTDPKCIWKPSVDDGTYFYTAQYKIDCGIDTQTKSIKGFITVMK